MLRLPPLSFCCCAVQRQEGVLKGGVWKKRSKGKREERRERERLGSTATAAAAAACQEKEGERETEGRKEGACLFKKKKGCWIALEAFFMFIFLILWTKERVCVRKPFFLPVDAFLYGLMQEACLEIA